MSHFYMYCLKSNVVYIKFFFHRGQMLRFQLCFKNICFFLFCLNLFYYKNYSQVIVLLFSNSKDENILLEHTVSSLPFFKEKHIWIEMILVNIFIAQTKMGYSVHFKDWLFFLNLLNNKIYFPLLLFPTQIPIVHGF
jgi:hypothetical protein